MDEHDAFFRGVIALIPKELYKAEEDESLNTRYFKHRLQPLQPSERKLLSKKRKLEKYGGADGEDGEGSGDDDDDDNQSQNGDDDDDDEDIEVIKKPETEASNLPSDPKARLRLKLQELKKQRVKDENAPAKTRVKQQQQSVPNKTQKPNKKGKHVDDEDDESSHNRRGNDDEHHTDLLMESIGADGDADIEFSSITANASKAASLNADYGKPGTKMQRMKRLLEVAESKRRRMEVLNASGEEGKAIAISEQWSEALKDASGENTTVDTKKLKKAIKKREKSKEKSAREWAGRLQDVSDAKNARLDKREKNLLLKKGVTPHGTPASSEAIEAARAAAAPAAPQEGGRKSLVGLNSKHTPGQGNSNTGSRPGFEGKGKAGKGFLNSKPGGSHGSKHGGNGPSNKGKGK